MFEKQKTVTMLQQKSEIIIDKNNELEAEFESEITNHNEDMRQAG